MLNHRCVRQIVLTRFHLLALWCDAPDLSIGLIRNYVEQAVAALTHITNTLSSFGK
jgi:hypothetical protein